MADVFMLKLYTYHFYFPLFSGSQQFHLAVLHPRSVAVYSLVIRGGNTDHGELI